MHTPSTPPKTTLGRPYPRPFYIRKSRAGDGQWELIRVYINRRYVIYHHPEYAEVHRVLTIYSQRLCEDALSGSRNRGLELTWEKFNEWWEYTYPRVTIHGGQLDRDIETWMR
jgi:hypothetical protein